MLTMLAYCKVIFLFYKTSKVHLLPNEDWLAGLDRRDAHALLFKLKSPAAAP